MNKKLRGLMPKPPKGGGKVAKKVATGAAKKTSGTKKKTMY